MSNWKKNNSSLPKVQTVNVHNLQCWSIALLAHYDPLAAVLQKLFKETR